MNKYRNIPCEVDGIRFDSKKEAARYYDLKLLERAGEIRDLRLQVPFELVPPHGKDKGVTYVADFVYQERPKCHESLDKAGYAYDWPQVVEDVKSPATRTDAYTIKRKLMYHIHGIRIREA